MNEEVKVGAPELAVQVVKVLIPPKTNDLDAQQRWRWVVFVAIVVLGVSQIIHIALSCGYLPALYSGFASEASTQHIQASVDAIASISFEREMRYKATELCTSKDPKIRQILAEDIAKLQREYYEIERHFYEIPPCDQL